MTIRCMWGVAVVASLSHLLLLRHPPVGRAIQHFLHWPSDKRTQGQSKDVSVLAFIYVANELNTVPHSRLFKLCI
jgi:hypothetical protein